MILSCQSVVAVGLPVPPLVITRAALWTPEGVMADREILIRDGRVTAVGGSGTLERPANARTIDAQGDTLLPGLIDAHVHLVSGVRLPDDFKAAARADVAAKQLLRSGVTAARIHLWDLASAVAFRRDAERDDFPSPRVQTGGPGIFGGQPDWYVEGGNVWGVKNAEDAAMKLKRLRDAGIEWVALHELQRFKPGELEAIVAEARRLGLRLIAGGDRIREVQRAIEAGVDSIEYLDSSDTPRYPDELVAEAKSRGSDLFFVPVAGFAHRFAAYRQGRMSLEDPRLTEFLPGEIAKFAGAALREDRTKEIRHAPKWTELPPTLAGKFRQLHEAGLRLVAGTDCGSPVHFHADAMWWELETWRQLGVPVNAIVRAATVDAAALLRDSTLGHLAVGARGDLVLYRGRLEDGPLSVQRVRVVAKGGVVFVNEGAWIEADVVPVER